MRILWAAVTLAAPALFATEGVLARPLAALPGLDAADREPEAGQDQDENEPSDRRARRRQDNEPSEDETVKPEDDDDPAPGCIFEKRNLELLV